MCHMPTLAPRMGKNMVKHHVSATWRGEFDTRVVDCMSRPLWTLQQTLIMSGYERINTINWAVNWWEAVSRKQMQQNEAAKLLPL